MYPHNSKHIQPYEWNSVSGAFFSVDSDFLFDVVLFVVWIFVNENIFGAVCVQCLCNNNKMKKTQKRFEVNLFEATDKSE